MLRYRRYRVFLVFAVIVVFALYQFGSQAPSVDYLKQHLNLGNSKHDSSSNAQELLKGGPPPPVPRPASEDANQDHGTKLNKNVGKGDDASKAVETKLTPPPVEDIEKPVQHAPPATKTTKPKTGGQDKEKSEEEIKPGKLSQVKEEDDSRVRVMPNPIPANSFEKIQPLLEQGEGRWEADQLPLDAQTVFWERPVEHFPLDDKSVINLPTGTPKKLPKIQANFDKETAEQKKDRLAKQDVIKEAFLHAWSGYKEKAWGHDEIKPVSGAFRDPFNGWGATLVDTLDLLWMMDLKDEFDEAVEQVSKIEFKTSRRPDIPLFETTIRYLGGLLGAYDVSGGKYRILLDKAVELAEILIGAFDTPNRMPDTFYQWKPTFASQAHRANTRVVLAELGSLALEFTRLAQLTKEPRYYDAIARITDALEEWQSRTRLPGMWPSYVDASGCEKPIISGSSLEQITADSSLNVMDSKGNPISKSGKGGKESKALSSKMGTTNRDEDELEGTEIKKGRIPGWDDIHDDEKPKDAVHEGDAAPKLPPPKKQPQKDKLGDVEFIPLKRPDPLVFKVDEVKKEKRQLNDLNAKDTAESAPSDGPSTGSGKVSNIPVQIPSHKHDNGVATTTIYTEEQECLPQGLQSQNRWGTDDFTLGSLADSTYEYLPKMYLMLNGLVPQYKTMYENAINAAKEHLLFRAMIPDEKREILIAGSYSVTRNYGTNEDGTIKEKKILRTASSHLTCFVGGMFAMGSKLFDRKDDLQIAKKLTDGCVYAYEMTATGIMPETFHAIACDNRKSCPWNQTKWWAELDPDLGKWRESNYESSMKYYRAQVAARESAITDAKNKKTAAAAAEKISKAASTPESTTLRSHSDMEKRQLNVVDDDELEDNTPIQLTEADYDTRIKGIDYFEKAAQAQDKYEELQVAKQLEVAKASPTIDLGPESTWEPPTLTEDEDALPPIYSPEKPPTHKEFVKTMIKEDRLPPGIQSMGDRRYILRPEAIESVFYMHRITGSSYWRRSGWTMISSILKHTRTSLAHSAIDDVTKTSPKQMDSMESFWLAETLKYAWLLFEEEDKWSFDEWVFNTEAHPLRRVLDAREGVPEGGVASKETKKENKKTTGKEDRVVTDKSDEDMEKEMQDWEA